MIACPVCRDAPLMVENVHGQPVDVCLKHGLWLDRTELYAVTERARHTNSTFTVADLFRREIRPPSRDRTLNCPHCNDAMRVDVYEGVQLDWCIKHGVWLDNGELEAILNNLRLDPLYLGRVATRLWETRY